MMMLTKNQLLTVDQIRLSAVLDTMDDAQFEVYRKRVEKFIVSYPELFRAVKEAFAARDQAALSRHLLAITGMAANIGVAVHAQAGFEVLSKYGETKYDEAAVLLDELLTAISTLSIDIQMAEHRNTDAAEKPAPDDYIVGTENGGGQKIILAVDDVSLLLNTLRSMLADSEYKFVGAISANAALKYLDKNRPDLFILDIEMPDMNGYDLANKIRTLGHKAPIIFLTGNATNDYVLKAIKAGAADFIVKPVNKEYVLEKIKRFI